MYASLCQSVLCPIYLCPQWDLDWKLKKLHLYESGITITN